MDKRDTGPVCQQSHNKRSWLSSILGEDYLHLKHNYHINVLTWLKNCIKSGRWQVNWERVVAQAQCLSRIPSKQRIVYWEAEKIKTRHSRSSTTHMWLLGRRRMLHTQTGWIQIQCGVPLPSNEQRWAWPSYRQHRIRCPSHRRNPTQRQLPGTGPYILWCVGILMPPPLSRLATLRDLDHRGCRISMDSPSYKNNELYQVSTHIFNSTKSISIKAHLNSNTRTIVCKHSKSRHRVSVFSTFCRVNF